MKKIIAGLVVSTLCSPAFSAEGRWTQGYGQGNLEYFIDQQGFSLYIGCPTQEGSADAVSYVALFQLSDKAEISKFSIVADGITYTAPFAANSRVGTNNFIALLASLRKGNTNVKFAKHNILLPQSNAADVIPRFDSEQFSCNLG
jgi:hypothetical protein